MYLRWLAGHTQRCELNTPSRNPLAAICPTLRTTRAPLNSASLATRSSPPGPMSGAMKVYSPRGMLGSPVSLMASRRPETEVSSASGDGVCEEEERETFCSVARLDVSAASASSPSVEDDGEDPSASVGAVLQLPALLTLPSRPRTPNAHSAPTGNGPGSSGCVTSKNSHPWPA